ncbi:transmembrane protein 33-like isoform X2 [Dysidea avara]|uniref:transmembrane protein 33-like isoform X2 n=1 Tax=Dysidea avara TaxID=196820 RepID=UPI00333475FF
MITVFLNNTLFGGGLLAPFFHYFFLKWRYSSSRNRYVKLVFYELRMTAQMLTQRPSCPVFIRNITTRIIDSLSYLAPTEQPQTTQQ